MQCQFGAIFELLISQIGGLYLLFLIWLSANVLNCNTRFSFGRTFFRRKFRASLAPEHHWFCSTCKCFTVAEMNSCPRSYSCCSSCRCPPSPMLPARAASSAVMAQCVCAMVRSRQHIAAEDSDH
jgi:hypothetical protein